MNHLTTAFIAAFAFLAIHGSAAAASVTLVKKENAGGGIGNFKYTYSYVCNDASKKGILQVTTGNNNEAKSLAELEANEKCGD
jgi:hypothetical protein